MPGLKVEACLRLDDVCADPVTDDETDGAGVATLTLPLQDVRGFRGLFRVTGEIDGAAIVPLLFDPARPIGAQTDAVADVLVPSEADIFGQLAGVEVDLTKGALAVASFDCRNSRAEGVTLQARLGDADRTPVYLRGSSPDPSADRTDASGGAVFFNLDVGDASQIRVTGAVADTGELVMSEPTTVRAGHLTTVLLRPRSAP